MTWRAGGPEGLAGGWRVRGSQRRWPGGDCFATWGLQTRSDVSSGRGDAAGLAGAQEGALRSPDSALLRLQAGNLEASLASLQGKSKGRKFVYFSSF